LAAAKAWKFFEVHLICNVDINSLVVLYNMNAAAGHRRVLAV